MRNVMKKELAGLILAAMFAMAGGAGAVTFTTTGAAAPACAGDVTIEASGVVKCTVTGGTTLLPSCAGDIVIDSKGVVRCGATAATAVPACTLSAAPSSVVAGGTSTLTASCTPAATSYLWSSATNFASNSYGGIVSPSVTTTYSVKGVNAAGTGGSASVVVTVNGTAQAPTAPTSAPTCTLTNSSGSFVQGFTDTLTANCSPAATSYAWSANAGCSSSSASCPVAPTVTTTYDVTGSNSAGSDTTRSTTVVKSAVCTLTASPTAIGSGETATLSASCSPAATSYTWTATPAGFTTATPSGIVSPANTTTYTVQGTTGTGPSAPVSATVTVSAPMCTLTTAPAMVDVGGSSTLTASCTPAATTGYVWSANAGTGCTPTSATCTVTPATAGIETYTVTGSNNSGVSAAASASVTVAVPSCTLTASPASITSGASSTLTASCSPVATSYTWSDPACLATSATCPVAPTATTPYTVAGSNAAGAGPTSSAATVTVNQPGALQCKIVDVTWSFGGVDLNTIPKEFLAAGQAIAYRVVIPNPYPQHSGGVYYGEVPTQISVSANPCEWTDAQRLAGCGSSSSLPQISLTGGTEADACQLTVGATYYFNVKNAYPWNGADTCAAGLQCPHYMAW